MNQELIPQNLIDQHYVDPIIAKICRESGPLPSHSDNRSGWYSRLVFINKNEQGEIGGYSHPRLADASDRVMIYLDKKGKVITSLVEIDRIKQDFPIIDRDGCFAPNRML